MPKLLWSQKKNLQLRLPAFFQNPALFVQESFKSSKELEPTTTTMMENDEDDDDDNDNDDNDDYEEEFFFQTLKLDRKV